MMIALTFMHMRRRRREGRWWRSIEELEGRRKRMLTTAEWCDSVNLYGDEHIVNLWTYVELMNLWWWTSVEKNWNEQEEDADYGGMMQPSQRWHLTTLATFGPVYHGFSSARLLRLQKGVIPRLTRTAIGTWLVLHRATKDPFNTQFNLYLFLPPATAIK